MYLWQVSNEKPEDGTTTWTVPVVWANLEIFRRDPNNFLSRLFTMCETWLYQYDAETKNNQWSDGMAPLSAPKMSECKNQLENFSPQFLGSRRNPPHWLPSKGPNYQSGHIINSVGAIEEHFEGKTSREFKQLCLVLARQCSGSPATWNPEGTGLPGLPLPFSPTLFYGSRPVELPPVPWTKKKDWKVATFRPTLRSLLPRRPGWTVKMLNFF